MTKALNRHLVFTALVLIVASDLSVMAQNRGWREIKGERLVQFDFNCASTSAYPDRKLNRIVRALSRDDTSL